MRDQARRVLERDKRLLSLGGDHAVSIGPIAAAAECHPGVGVLQVDAHLDLRDAWNGSRWNHACVMRRVVDDLQLPAVQVGIRSFCAEEAALVRQRGFRPFYAHAIHDAGQGWIEAVVEALPPEVYLTIDLDGLDPAVLPGTGTPEPGGLSYRQLLALIRAVGRRRRVVAADITELAKIPGTQVSEYTAARIAAKIMVTCWAEG
jgi:agmatinase